jgi:hypothetical protein
MSQENAEIVRDYLKGRYRTADIWDPNGDYYPEAKFPESRPCHGHREIARFFRDFEQAWGTVEITVENSTPIGDDRVLARCIIAGEGRESGLSLESEIFYCFWLRHGRIFREEDHLTLPGALHALGLDGDSPEAVGLRE